jgi:hypothetical protein
MGYGAYSHAAHEALLGRRANLPTQHVFAQRECHPLMNPKGIGLRECRDSEAHPQSLGIAFALDVTGSMGEIPTLLATKQLPTFMKVLTDCGVRDPQLLFVAVGDATSDRAPLQVGQFEATAELMDQWLTWSYLEGRGGPGDKESYELALYFLALHTEMDCVVKRQKRGYMFMTGDELPYPALSRHVVDTILGDRLDEDLSCEEIVAELQKTYAPFFIIPDPARARRCERRWRDLLGDHVLVMQSAVDTCFVTAGAILLGEGLAADVHQAVRLLGAAGLSRERTGFVAETLKPLASALHGGGSASVKTSPSAEGPGNFLRRLLKK